MSCQTRLGLLLNWFYVFMGLLQDFQALGVKKENIQIIASLSVEDFPHMENDESLRLR